MSDLRNAAQAALDCEIAPRPLSHPLRDYHIAISEGPLNYTWQDKPHRLVYDLIAAVRYYAAPQDQQPMTDEQMALKEERERCATICDEYADKHLSTERNARATRRAARVLAELIRK